MYSTTSAVEFPLLLNISDIDAPLPFAVYPVGEPVKAAPDQS